jgi:tetratricopeptide (TPR) repeat protein
VLDEFYSITKLNTDKEINDFCYSSISSIYLELKEYDKAMEAAKKYGIENNLMVGYNKTILTSLIAQGKKDEAEKHIHNANYFAVAQIYVNFMQSMQISHDDKDIKKKCAALINMLKIFSDDSPGPFDFYLITPCHMLACVHLGSGEFDACIKYLEEICSYIERFKVFSETKEITSDFIKFADKEKFVYNLPFDYKKHILMAFEAFANMPEDSSDYKNYAEISRREDFKKIIKKLKG